MALSRLLISGAALALFASASHAAALFEGFDDLGTLGPAGWVRTNNSTATGTTPWFQGNPGVFDAHSGAPEAYAAANYGDGFSGNVSNWLITPTLTFNNGDVLSFYTRTNGAFPGDTLEIRLSTNGASSNVGGTDSSVGDFTSLLTTVSASYPTAWTQFTVNISGLGGPTSGRLAFRYVVSDTTLNGDYIGLDTVSVNPAVPEPSTWLTLGAGIAMLAMKRTRPCA